MNTRIINSISLTMLMILSSTVVIQADWLDDLAQSVSNKKEWNFSEANKVIGYYTQKANERVNSIKKRIADQQPGFWSLVHTGAYRIELSAAETKKKYYENIAHTISQLHENRNYREKLLTQLLDLALLKQHLKEFKEAFSKAQDTGGKFKLGAKIAAKQTELSAKKSFIKSSFLTL